jgi:phosphatidylglycerol:prolipoprotein diacylglycerol transferase
VHPTLITIPGLDFEVQAYGFALGAALVLGWIWSLRLALRDRLPPAHLGTSYVLAAVCGMFAARAVYLLQHPERFDSARALLQLAPGGLAGFAGALVGLVVTVLHARAGRVPVWAWLDCLAPALTVGVALERGGAFLAGTEFGRYVDPGFPLAVTYPIGSPAYTFHASTLDALLPNGATRSLPVHPTQLYVATFAVLLFAVVSRLRRRRSFSGQAVLTVVGAHVAFAVLVERPLRADTGPVAMGPAQVLGLLLAGALAVVYVTRLRRARAEPGALQLWNGGPWSPTAPP